MSHRLMLTGSQKDDIAGGMGQRAQVLFAQHGIQVVMGVSAETPEKLLSHYLAGTLEVGENVCDH
jgi:predicted Fe-Mo cluster-binding NifX family protein